MKEQAQVDHAAAAPARAAETPRSTTEQNALALQRSAGNAAVASLVASTGSKTPLTVMRNGTRAPTPTADQRDVAAYNAARARHDRNRTTVQGWLTSGAAQTADRMLRNSCQWAQTRGKIYVLTRTHDSAARCTAASHPGGAAWFSYPAGELAASAVYYTRRAAATDPWDNTNIDFEDSPDVDGFNDSSQNVIALMETAIARGSAYFYSVLKHETQHAADDHGNSDIEGYKTEFRAYWLGSREFDSESPTTRVNHLGYEWNARQWAIFNNLYNDAAYDYVKTAWDAENSEPDRSHRAFQSAVVAFGTPESINPANSTRVDDFYRALHATTTADCTADSAASPNAHVAALRTALGALEAADRTDIHGNHLYDSLLTAHLADPVLTEVRTALGR